MLQIGCVGKEWGPARGFNQVRAPGAKGRRPLDVQLRPLGPSPAQGAGELRRPALCVPPHACRRPAGRERCPGQGASAL